MWEFDIVLIGRDNDAQERDGGETAGTRVNELT